MFECLFAWPLRVFAAALSVSGCGVWDLVLWPGVEPWPLHWVLRVLVTGLQGSPLGYFFPYYFSGTLFVINILALWQL